ncbi:MAG: glycosyl hydrolase 38 domain protein [Clostridiales bacterium]|nr:glycosyl hydrolase 38 domain protein [Clostridiales bacterium]
MFHIEKIERILDDIKKTIIKNKVEILSFKMKEGTFKGGEILELDDSDWDNYECGCLWGGYDKSVWFRLKLKLPESFKKEMVYISVQTGREGQWDALNPQFLLFENGQLKQGLDVNHREAVIREKDQSDDDYISLALHGYSGLFEKKCILESCIFTINEEIKRLYYNILVPLECAKLFNEDDKNRIKIVSLLEETIALLDTRNLESKNFFDSANNANVFIEEQLYGSINNDGPIITAIGHTHIDIAWLWTIDQTREKAARSFSTVIELMKKYPFYKFMASQPVLYNFVKEDYKSLYEKIEQKISEGQWEADGVMYLEPDCNLPSGEALIRQCYYGVKFFSDEFNVKCNTLWLPDVFGFNGNLPQIMRGCGIKYFATTKLDWNDANRLPHDTFVWKGIDGSEVLAHLITTCEYTPDNSKKTRYEGVLNPSHVLGTWHRYHDKEISNEVLLTYGYGDGGGGPTKEEMEYGSRLIKGIPGMPVVKTGFQSDFFKRLENNLASAKNVPKWYGELYFEYHRGTYTSMAKNKKYNRKSEVLVGIAEYLGTLNNILGGVYPREDIEKAWKIILLNQFHDILPGTSIKAVYDESHRQYKEVLNNLEGLIQSLMDNICKNINIDNPSIVVFNNSPFIKEGLIETEGLMLKNDNGILPYQKLENGKTLISVPNIPSKGYKLLSISNKSESIKNPLIINENHMENEYFNIKFNDSMEIQSLVYKPLKREVLKKGQLGNVITAYEDRPSRWENWDIEIYYKDKSWQISKVLESRIIEVGPIRGGILIRRGFESSEIIQKIFIYNNIPRIDFDTTIQWKEKDILLKTNFPIDINSNKANFDIQYGNIERNIHENTSWDAAQFEEWQHKWVDISEDDFGVSILNDCKYGGSAKFDNLTLTMLKSGTYPNIDADRETHHFVYSLYPHDGNFKNGGTIKEAYNLNIPLYTFMKDNSHGMLRQNISMISSDKENIIVEVLKMSEDKSGYIARIYECSNRRTKANIKFAFPMLEAFECDMLENINDKLVCDNSQLNLNFNSYEIKTILIKIQK